VDSCTTIARGLYSVRFAGSRVAGAPRARWRSLSLVPTYARARAHARRSHTRDTESTYSNNARVNGRYHHANFYNRFTPDHIEESLEDRVEDVEAVLGMPAGFDDSVTHENFVSTVADWHVFVGTYVALRCVALLTGGTTDFCALSCVAGCCIARTTHRARCGVVARCKPTALLLLDHPCPTTTIASRRPAGAEPVQLRKGVPVSQDFTTAAEYELSLDIFPTGTKAGWSNILHISSTGENCCGYGDRVPAVWFFNGTTRLHIVTGSNSSGAFSC
jgi:hypothetical protein